MPLKKAYRKRAVKRPYKKRAYKPRKNNLVKTIKRVIHSQIENKYLGIIDSNLPLAYAGSVTNPTYLNLCPNINQGSNSAQRNGNEVNIVKGKIHGFVNLLPYNGTTNQNACPIYVKMWLCRRKQGTGNMAGQLTPPTTTSFSNFFQVANVSSGFQGGMLDIVKYNNPDCWQVFAKKTIQLSNVSVAFGGTGAVVPASGQCSAPFTFDFSKHLGKLKFDEAYNVPTNRELFLVFQGVLADGSINALGSFAEIHYQTEWQFEDA